MDVSTAANYNRWNGMMQRCTNPQAYAYEHYGGRGISVCDRWKVFENFNEDMGDPPTPEHTLERLDVNGNYEPGNCTWATRQEQARNRRNNVHYEHNGEQHLLDDLAEEYSISPRTLRDRIKKQGMSMAEALVAPKRWTNVYVTVDGQQVTQTEAARKGGISVQTLRSRLGRGMSLEEALATPVRLGRPRQSK